MRFPWTEKRAIDYGDAVTAAIANAALGDGAVLAGRTAAEEVCSRLVRKGIRQRDDHACRTTGRRLDA